MTTFTLTIDDGNAAFEAENRDVELARILRNLAREIEHGACLPDGKVHDINGNTVGHYTGALLPEPKEAEEDE